MKLVSLIALLQDNKVTVCLLLQLILAPCAGEEGAAVVRISLASALDAAANSTNVASTQQTSVPSMEQTKAQAMNAETTKKTQTQTPSLDGNIMRFLSDVRVMSRTRLLLTVASHHATSGWTSPQHFDLVLHVPALTSGYSSAEAFLQSLGSGRVSLLRVYVEGKGGGSDGVDNVLYTTVSRMLPRFGVDKIWA